MFKFYFSEINLSSISVTESKYLGNGFNYNFQNGKGFESIFNYVAEVGIEDMDLKYLYIL